MPSFRFHGFAEASTVALSVAQGAQSVEANLVWAQALTSPSASFSITRVDGIDDSHLVSPFPAWFAPTGITGFVGFDGQPISEPPDDDTNVYDPTALEIFWSWDFGDAVYEPLVTPNTPTSHRDTNKAFAKRPCHVFKTPGSKTVTLYAFDSAGNWGTAQYVFGEGGDSPAIADPDEYFVGNLTCYYSEDGIFPDPLPAGAVTATSMGQVGNFRTNRNNAGDSYCRVLTRRGEVYEGSGKMEGSQDSGLATWFGAYGDPEDPPPKFIRTNTNNGPWTFYNGSSLGVISDQDWEGGYDAATETGFRTNMFGNNGTVVPNMLIHRSRFSGMNALFWAVVGGAGSRVLSDSEVTNWQDYGLFGQSSLGIAVIGCDVHQKQDALNGIDQGISQSNPTNMGNRHGPLRHSATRTVYVACSSFFARNGWSSFSNTAFADVPPTVAQLAFRSDYASEITHRNYNTWERNTFEGGSGAHVFGRGGGISSLTYASNVLHESNLVVMSAGAWGDTTIGGKGQGYCVRNTYFYAPAVKYRHGRRFERFISWGSGSSKVFIFNNTAVIAAPEADIGSFAEPRVLAAVDASQMLVEENNIYYAPNLTSPIGTSFEPLGSDPLDGFTPRYLGNRWNFPPIGHERAMFAIDCEDVREDGAGPVAPGEWMAFDYPDYTGKCRGAGNALAPLTQAQVLANSGQYHQVSVKGYGSKAMAPAAVGGDGRVVFDFTPTKIRIQNNTNGFWDEGSWTGAVWVLLDLRDYLMDFDAETATPGAVPAAVPGAGSAARGASGDGLWARNDFFGAARTQPGTRGAMEAAI